jgi:hypothetical protein
MDAETLLSFAKTEVRETELDPFGSVRIKLLSAGDAMRLMAERPDENDGDGLVDWICRLIGKSLVDVNDKPVLTEAQIVRLQDMPLDMINGLQTAILDANGMTAEAEDERPKG